MRTSAIQKSLDISWKEGIPAAAMQGIADYYLIPYSLLMGATTQQIGWLVAVPQLLASVSQLFAVRAVHVAGSRLRLIVRTATLQALFLLPLALLAFFPFPGAVRLLIGLTIAFRVLGSLVATAWGSLVSDYLPAGKRGHYFGWRSQIVGTSSTVAIGLAGTLLYFMNSAVGFSILFGAASLCRLISASLLARMTDLPVAKDPGSDFTFWTFLRRFKENNLAKYVFYVSSMMFVTFLAAPYFSVYMLRDLTFDYLSYMWVHLAAVVAGLIAYPIWGRHADLVGNARILKVIGFFIPSIPLLWLLSHHRGYLVAVEFFSGFVWGGFMLCATNFIYDAVSPEKRVRCLGYFNVMNGIAIFAGASLGGFLATRLLPLKGFSLLALFCLSGLLRLLVHLCLAPHFKEVREGIHAVSQGALFLSVVGIRPLRELSRQRHLFPVEGHLPSER